jgi:methionyl-tRNA formyltransferase
LKIVVFGHQNWLIKGLETLNSLKCDVLHVFTHPLDMDKNEKVWYSSAVSLCNKLSIPVSERKKIIPEDIELIKKINPDLILSLGWRRLIPKIIFTLPKLGTINIHDSLLPKYRGFAPINWSVINGEKESGITAHYIDDNIDTGNILLQKKVSIDPNDTATIVYNKLIDIYPEFIKSLVTNVESNNIKIISQSNNEGFVCSRRFPKDGKIDWKNDRTKIFNLVRGLSDPYPNAFFIFKKKIIFIKNIELSKDDFRGMAGTICSKVENGVIVTCGINHLENQGILIKNISINGKIMNSSKFFKLWDKLD